ncbi:hypothetical protein FPV67DRAFT_343405 [Lyophyllum atratum]|nr:hypothetical protein FPV67DRAFT_343405 [Lyophyllum atratum]
MSVLLPPELIDSVLSHLRGTPQSQHVPWFATLGCRMLDTIFYHRTRSCISTKFKSWNFFILLIHLDPRSHCYHSVRYTSHRTLKVVPDNPIPPDGNAWRNDTAVRDFFVRDLTFSVLVPSSLLSSRFCILAYVRRPVYQDSTGPRSKQDLC